MDLAFAGLATLVFVVKMALTGFALFAGGALAFKLLRNKL